LGVLEDQAEVHQIEDALQEGMQLLRGAHTPRMLVRHGHAAEKILEEAESGHYHLVIVGSRGRRGLTRFLLGSTAERIAHHAASPVLVVQGQREVVRRILVCTAARALTMTAVELGGQVARLVRARLTVLHVMSQLPGSLHTPVPLLTDLEAPAEVLIDRSTPEGAFLQETLIRLGDMTPPAQACVRHGLVVDEIMAEMINGDYDLVVIGAHAAEGWMRFLLDDSAGRRCASNHHPRRPSGSGSKGAFQGLSMSGQSRKGKSVF
jgi:nucleotide-binding universal stress UspA family protein